MASSSERPAPRGRRGWTWLRGIGRLFRMPAAPVLRVDGACTPEAVDPTPVGLRVLVADDNPVNRMVASEMLRYLGVQPLLAADGAEAVAMAARIRLDLILMDLQMPVLDGLDASRQIRRFEQAHGRARMPVVAYTSLGSHRLRPWDHEFDGVLAKPCELQDMRACLLHWCPADGSAAQALELRAMFRP